MKDSKCFPLISKLLSRVVPWLSPATASAREYTSFSLSNTTPYIKSTPIPNPISTVLD